MNGFIFIHITVVCYIFYSLAIVCDDYFIPSLQLCSEVRIGILIVPVAVNSALDITEIGIIR